MGSTGLRPLLLLCSSSSSSNHSLFPPFSSSKPSFTHLGPKSLQFPPPLHPSRRPYFATPNPSNNNKKKNKSEIVVAAAAKDDDEAASLQLQTNTRTRLTQSVLWAMEAVYIFWLFLLPFAPGDPVWAISNDTINSLVGLSLNFFFILPISNSVGIHALEAPVLHPMSEGLFNFVVAWTFMFAPLLYTDFKNSRYKGSLDVLWGLQMFLTNTFLIPYMAIRLNEADASNFPKKPSQLGSVMIKGASIVGLVGGFVCAISIWWVLYGRMDGNFGNVNDRWNFLLEYLGSERLAYAFIWDIVLYTIFQPWLIGENLANVVENRVALVNYMRYIPVVGLIAYLIFLKRENVADQLE